MNDTADPALVRALRQNASTLALLGVDFLPVRGTADTPPAPAPAPAARPIAAPQVEPKPPPVVAAAPAPKPRKPAAPGPRDPQAQLDELRERYEREAPHKKFVTSFTNIVFGEGSPEARLMFVGEAPGAEEDRLGRPFVGRSGQLLDKMINAMGLSREQVYIANVLKTRPPDNATPTSDECAACAPYLYEQIMIIRPEAIVTLGLPASRTLLNTMDSMSNLRGRWHRFAPPMALFNTPAAAGLEPDWGVPVMATYHPAFLLRSYTPENRAKVWSDLRQVMERLGLTGNAGRPETGLG